jgi:hypothetical protein
MVKEFGVIVEHNNSILRFIPERTENMSTEKFGHKCS